MLSDLPAQITLLGFLHKFTAFSGLIFRKVVLTDNFFDLKVFTLYFFPKEFISLTTCP